MAVIEDMAFLKKLSISGFKSIRELSNFELGRINILIGANGAGKSNFIQVFDFIHQTINRKLQIYTGRVAGADNILHFGKKITNKLVMQFDFDIDQNLSNSYNISLLPTDDDRFIFENEVMLFHDAEKYPSPYIQPINSAHKESELIQSAKKHKMSGYIRTYLENCRVYHFHDTGKDSKIKITHPIADSKILHTDASNLAAYLLRLKESEPDYYQNIVETIQLTAPFFNDFILEPTYDNDQMIRLEWQEKGSDKIFNAHALSDGTLRFICLAVLLIQPVMPDTIILDEPELGLHPFAIQLLYELLQSASKEAQIIVSTQSVTLVNHFKPQDIIIVEHEKNSSTFKRPSAEEINSWIDDYTLGDIWEKNLMGGRP